jgi:hypothetical protein
MHVISLYVDNIYLNIAIAYSSPCSILYCHGAPHKIEQPGAIMQWIILVHVQFCCHGAPQKTEQIGVILQELIPVPVEFSLASTAKKLSKPV